MEYFGTCKTIEEAQSLRRKLAFENHPDRGGDAEIFKRIEAEFREFEIVMKHLPTFQKPEKKQAARPDQPLKPRIIVVPPPKPVSIPKPQPDLSDWIATNVTPKNVEKFLKDTEKIIKTGNKFLKTLERLAKSEE